MKIGALEEELEQEDAWTDGQTPRNN